jgi:membrane protease YdiL (CAAX protease family)
MFGLFVIYWPFNILGENFIWRGVILPRMVERFGKAAWALNAFLWGIFHIAFGLGKA